MQIVLAIDDAPERYVKFSQVLRDHEILLVCIQTMVGAEMVLGSGKVVAVLLDHDMPTLTPFGWMDPETRSASYTNEFSGQYFAKNLLVRYGIPVGITSANPEGANRIAEILEEYAVPFEKIPCTDSGHLNKWLAFTLKAASTL